MLLLLSILILGSASAVTAEESQQISIKILFGYRFPPFYTVTSKKSPSSSLQGAFIDILEKFKKSYPQYTLKYKCLPRARISKVLIEGGADAFALSNPMFIPPELNGRYTASIPLWNIGDHLLVRAGSPIDSSDLDSLIGKRIAVLHGNGYGPLDEYFESGIIRKHSVYSTTQILELVLKGRVDGAVCNKTTLPALMKRAGLSMDDFTVIESPLYTFNLHLLVKRDQMDFLNDFNKFLKHEKIPKINN